jgi:hypothetical protein
MDEWDWDALIRRCLNCWSVLWWFLSQSCEEEGDFIWCLHLTERNEDFLAKVVCCSRRRLLAWNFQLTVPNEQIHCANKRSWKKGRKYGEHKINCTLYEYYTYHPIILCIA